MYRHTHNVPNSCCLCYVYKFHGQLCLLLYNNIIIVRIIYMQCCRDKIVEEGRGKEREREREREREKRERGRG